MDCSLVRGRLLRQVQQGEPKQKDIRMGVLFVLVLFIRFEPPTYVCTSASGGLLICIGAEALPVADAARRRWSKTTSTKKGAPSPTEYDYVLIRMVVADRHSLISSKEGTDNLYIYLRCELPSRD